MIEVSNSLSCASILSCLHRFPFTDDEDDEDLPLPGAFGRSAQAQGSNANAQFGRGGILSQLMGGMGNAGGFGAYPGMTAGGMMGYGAPSRPS